MADEIEGMSMRERRLVGALFRDAADIDALIELGGLLSEQNRDREAADVYRQALTLHPEHSIALLKLGSLLHSYPAFRDEAIALLARVLSLDATVTDAYRPLAWSLAQSDRSSDAISVLRKWCAAAPDDPAATHLLAAYSGEAVPERASDAFVQQTFDRAADQFDVYMRNTLQYRAPELLAEHLGSLLPKAAHASLDVLDIGCGTGLSAPLLRPWARRLVGVDLSSGMLAKAREGGRYDVLDAAELTAYLRHCHRRSEGFDVLFGADTLIYFGSLEAVFARAFAALRGGGWLAFSLEQIAQQSVERTHHYVLTRSGRYQHSARYVREALKNAGYLEPHMNAARIRSESNEPEVGLVIAAMKPG